MLHKLKKLINIFTRVTTLSFIFSSLYILFMFGASSLLNLRYVWGILLIGAVSTVASIPFLSEKELSKGCLIFSQILYFVLIDAVVLFVGCKLRWYSLEEKRTVIGIEIAIIAVYVCGFVVTYIADIRNATRMNEKLKNRHKE